MCQRCVDAVRKYYPQVSDEDMGDFLMAATAFPAGGSDLIERQLKEAKEATDGSVEAACAFACAQVDAALETLGERN